MNHNPGMAVYPLESQYQKASLTDKDTTVKTALKITLNR